MEIEDVGVEALMAITSRPPMVFIAGEGSWMMDRAGRRYLDFVQGWAVNSLGHSPRPVIEALARQASQLINCSPAFYNAPAAQLAGLLVRASGLDRVFFASSGAEANEGAIKLARKWGARHKAGAFEIITMEQAFHGRTLATMSASGKPGWDALFEPKVAGFRRARLNDLASVAALIGPRTAAIMVEPIQGESGVIPATDEFLKGLEALVHQHRLLLMVDEVQTGMGRTGALFGFQRAGIAPDIMTLGKGIGGGVPLAALLAKEEVCCFEPGDQGGTFNGNPLMTAVGVAVFEEIMKPGFLDDVVRKGQVLRERLASLSAKHGLGEVRGRGLLVALELGRDIGAAVVAAAMERGLLLNAPRPSVLRFMPSLTVTQDEVDRMIERLEAALCDVSGNRVMQA
jgi:acetylornithine/N-succinyldiaminopimelate aminotransferase